MLGGQMVGLRRHKHAVLLALLVVALAVGIRCYIRAEVDECIRRFPEPI